MKELTIEAVIKNIDQITDFINAELEAMGCPMKTQMQIDMAIDELFTNISSYAYAPGTGNVTVQVDRSPDSRTIDICFIDSGSPFDPTARTDPDTSLSAEERQIGGLGIFLVKKMMDEMKYTYEGGKNIIRIKKTVR